MTTKTRTYIRSALRKIWQWSPERKEVKQRARVALGQYECEKCHSIVKKVDIDHITPVGPTPGSRNDKHNRTWDDFIKSLFCPVSNLQALCKSCHKSK